MHYHVAISQESDVEQAVQALHDSTIQSLGPNPPDLAFLFFSSFFSENTSSLQALIREKISPHVLVGCMNNGVIGGVQEFESEPAIILWSARLPDVTVRPIRLEAQEQNGHLTLHGWPESIDFGKKQPYVFLFADPFTSPIEEMFASIERDCPGSPVIGGIASGGTDSGENRLLLNQNTYDSGVVGVVLWGQLDVRTVVSQGCQPIGEPYVVTKAERNIIYELGGMSMLERLKITMQSIRANNPSQVGHQSLQVGIAMDEYRGVLGQGDFLIRDLMGADERSGGVSISDVVQEGQTLQFHVRDANAADQELTKLLAEDQSTHVDQPAKGVLLFSCICRGERLFSHPHHDIQTVREQIGAIPIAGFFAGGEIGPVGGKNYLHGYTASVALFCDPQESDIRVE